jgi:hypothetical protein
MSPHNLRARSYRIEGPRQEFVLDVKRKRSLIELLPAAFLTLWLGGWLLGELFAIAALYTVATGKMPMCPGGLCSSPQTQTAPPAAVEQEQGGAPVEFASTAANTPSADRSPTAPPLLRIGVGAFIAVWLAGWTVGGLSAASALAGILRSTIRYAFSGDQVTLPKRSCCGGGETLKFGNPAGIEVSPLNSGWAVRLILQDRTICLGLFEDDMQARKLAEELRYRLPLLTSRPATTV